MAVSTVASGMQVATFNTEHSLSLVSSAGVYVLAVNLRFLANGDEVELRAYQNSGGGSRHLAYVQGYRNKQGDGTIDSGAKGAVVAFSVPIPSPLSIRFTLKQTADTSGTNTSATNTTLVDTGANWETNKFIGHTVTCNGKTMEIVSNTTTTLTGASWSGGGNPGSPFTYRITTQFDWAVYAL
jgi:hypothetical protein